MSEILQGLLKLNGKISSKNSDSFIYDLNISKENISFLRLIYEDELVEAYRNVSGQLVNVENLENLIGQVISIEFVTAQLKKTGYYLSKNDFIISNRFEEPPIYYIEELKYLSTTNEQNEEIQKYLAAVSLISNLVSKAKFLS